MEKHDIIEQLGLEHHPLEGGYFTRTYESDERIANSRRRLLTSIYYMLTDNNSVGFLHKNRSDIIHYFHSGDPITYVTISESGELEKHVLGMNLYAGQRPQLLVRGGCWKASVLTSGEYGLISEAVSPGFEYCDNELATVEAIGSRFPNLLTTLRPYIKNQTGYHSE